MADKHRRRRATWGLAAACGLALAAAAAGQENSWFFEVIYSDAAGVINSPDDWVTVNLWAAFDPKYYAFGGAELNFITADDPLDAGLWSEPEELLNWQGSLDGAVEGESVVGMITWQFHLPPNFLADNSNPIWIWTASWQTGDMTPRGVALTTDTLWIWVYKDQDGNFAQDLSGTMSEGSGEIVVVPVPAFYLPLAVLGLRWRRSC